MTPMTIARDRRTNQLSLLPEPTANSTSAGTPGRVSLPLRSRWRLKVLMADRGLSARDLATRIGELCGKVPHAQTISNWQINPDTRPPIAPEFWAVLPQALECSYQDLWAGYDESEAELDRQALLSAGPASGRAYTVRSPRSKEKAETGEKVSERS